MRHTRAVYRRAERRDCPYSRVSTLAAEASWIMRTELLAVEIGQNRFNPAGDGKLAIDVVKVSLHGIE